MLGFRKFVLITVIILFSGHFAFAVTKTINSGSWLVSGNWSPTGLPQDGDTIYITGNVELPFQDNDINLSNVRIIVTSTGYWTIKKKCDVTLSSGSAIIIEAGGAIEGTHGNSVAIVGNSGNLIGNKVYNGPQAANENGWTDGTSPLPIELTSFIVQMLEDHALIEWSTASETNNDYFVIERKTETSEWESVGQIHGNGTTNELHFYQYEDYEVNPNELAYYQLLQVDFDGKEHRHHIIRAEGIEIQGHRYKIVRTESIVEVVFEDDHEEFTEVMLIDSYGVVLAKESLGRAVKGYHVKFDLAQYPTGWYVVGISGTDNFHFEKMIHVK